MASEHYQVVGQNNRNALVQSKRVAPYHEDLTKVQVFEPSSVAPGQYSKIKLDFKHAMDRELILNDIRLEFQLDFSKRGVNKVGRVYAVRGTDLIRELVIKINEDIIFKSDKRYELSMLWEMNNHKTGGDQSETHNAFLLNYGNIPSGIGSSLHFKTADNTYYDLPNYSDIPNTSPFGSREALTQVGFERHDGFVRLVYDDSESPTYAYRFSISLNQLIGPVFHRLHMRRIEFVQIEVMFEPFVSTQDTAQFLLFKKVPTLDGATTVSHPWSVASITNLQIRQYRTTLLDGIQGFTLPDNRMLSWLMHRYTRREYQWNFDTSTFLDIQLHDWEIRTNIVRVWWMLAPITKGTPSGSTFVNGFCNFGEPSRFDNIYAVEVRWKNDVVLDLATTFDVYRHYTLSDNKRYGSQDPFMKFRRLVVRNPATDNNVLQPDQEMPYYSYVDETNVSSSGPSYSKSLIGRYVYEFPIYHVDLNMNIQHAVPGTELIGGIVNDTSDYVIRIKRPTDRPAFINSGTQTLWVFLEYQTLVNLAAGSNQFNRGSQIVTKQLNPQ